jgi:radical SAM superfamily enzyme YgiQ (UPF0313 family)
MRIGVLDLLADSESRGCAERIYGHYFRRQFTSIMPQIVSVWCRQLGHDVHYRTFYGQKDPLSLLPADLDIVFISAYTQASALAYALSRIWRQRGTLTVLGGPHAKAFPQDCLRFFDIVVGECDRNLIEDILAYRVEVPSIAASDRAPTQLPTIEERLPEIALANFDNGRPLLTSVIPVIASLGCPYSCDFCTDWNTKYVALDRDRLLEDLRYVATRHPRLHLLYHDPNFAVRFDEMMDIIEQVPESCRNPYIMESSLSILKPERLERLRRTNCVYIAPGVESWADYSRKAGAGSKVGRDKLESVVAQFERLSAHVPGLQANFILGADCDAGPEPVQLTKEFMRRLPFVFPTINIPTPYGGTPLYDRIRREHRLLETMPFAFYYIPNLVIRLRGYHPIEYYRHLVELHELASSMSMVAARLQAKGSVAIRMLSVLRTTGIKRDCRELRRILGMLRTDREFREFHEGRLQRLPVYYRYRLDRRLGRYGMLLSEADLTPVHA